MKNQEKGTDELKKFRNKGRQPVQNACADGRNVIVNTIENVARTERNEILPLCAHDTGEHILTDIFRNVCTRNGGNP